MCRLFPRSKDNESDYQKMSNECNPTYQVVFCNQNIAKFNKTIETIAASLYDIPEDAIESIRTGYENVI